MTSLLDRQPENRIGSGPRGADEIKEHPFFEEIDWNAVLNKAYKVDLPHIRHVETEAGPMA